MKKALKLAIDALKDFDYDKRLAAIKVCEEALKSLTREQGEPVECMCGICKLGPLQRTWVGLTDEDKLHIEIIGGKSDVMLAETIEAALKQKNGYNT